MYCFLFVVGLSLFAPVFSQTLSTYFINPPAAGDELFFAENQAYAVGSTFDVQWVTDQDAYNIFLWQQSLDVQSAAEGSTPIYTKITGSDEQGGFSWTVSVQQFNLDQSNVFFLALSPAGEQDLNGATTSHYFNVTAASESTSSLASSSASSTPTPSIPPTSTSAPTVTATVTSAPVPVASPSQSTVSSSSKSSTTTGVGIGVGLGLGIPLLLLLGFTFMPRRYRRRLFAAKPPSYANSVDRDNAYAGHAEPVKTYVGELPSSEAATLVQPLQNQYAAPVELEGWQTRMSRVGHPPGSRG